MVNFFILNKFFLAHFPFLPFYSFGVRLCRQRIRNIHWCYLNKFSSSFISPSVASLSHALLSLFAYYTYCLLDSTLLKKKGKKTTKRKSFFFLLPTRGTSAHNILWWTLLRMMMITIIIMNIFSPFHPISEPRDPRTGSYIKNTTVESVFAYLSVWSRFPGAF